MKNSFERPPVHKEQKIQPGERIEKLRERLKLLVPKFLEIRQKMGFDDRIGFGFLKEVHEGEITLGSLPTIKKSQRNGQRKYSTPNFLVGVFYKNISEEDEKNILIMPNPDREGKIVSVFDPAYEIDKWEKLANASDDVFVGIIAHELAHEFKSGSQLPQNINHVLKQRLEDEYGIKHKNWQAGNDEEEIDIIASSFGYKDQIIAKLDFVIKRIGEYGPYFKEKERLIRELERRKQQVLKYCP